MRVAKEAPVKKRKGPRPGKRAEELFDEAQEVADDNPGMWVEIVTFTSNYGWPWVKKNRRDDWELIVEADRGGDNHRVIGTTVWGKPV